MKVITISSNLNLRLILGLNLLLITLTNHAEATGSVIEITNQTELTQLQNQASKNQQSLIVKFYSPGCGHCNKIQGPYNNLATQSKYQKIVFAAINTQKYHDLARKYHVSALPTFVIFDSTGKEINRLKGGPIGKIEAALNELL